MCGTSRKTAHEARGSRDRVVIVAHCIMNQSTRARWEGGGASRVKGAVEEVIGPLVKHGVGMIQMECPEQALYGNPRPPKSRDDYDTPGFKDKCSEIAVNALRALGDRRTMELIAVLGLEGSPSCGVERTTRTIENVHTESPGEGHLIEALRHEMKKEGCSAPIIGVRLRDDEMSSTLRRLESLLKG